MRTINTSLTVVLGVTIGATITSMCVSRGVVRAPSSTAELRRVAPQASTSPEAPGGSRSQADVRSGEPSGLPASAHTAVPVTPPSVDATAVVRDDSTYLRMLEFMQARSLSPRLVRDLTEMHERFLLTPDDPNWGRRTEQALRDFFHARSAASRLEITSIACRATSCEVQAQGERFDEHGVFSAEVPAMSAPLREARPLGRKLEQPAPPIIVDLGDRISYLVTYTRVEPTPGVP